MAVSVFLFTGFLESGKTSFIQQTLQNINFCTGEPTLLLICEEGECEYEPERFANTGVSIEVLNSREELTRENLAAMANKAQASRVLVEYNGMWMIDELLKAMPDDWCIFREMMFADAKSFVTYNNNMRQLMYDKLKSCLVTVLNFSDDSVDKAMIHKIIRGASRKSDIVYQLADGSLEYDQIVDQPNFDINAAIVEIEYGDYAEWARDITEEPYKYQDKVLRIKALMVAGSGLSSNEFGIGRYVMVCCEDDIQFIGFACIDDKDLRPNDSGWYSFTVKTDIRFHPSYGKNGPVFTLLSCEETQAPEHSVATFY